MTAETVRSWIGERIVMDRQVAPGISVEESYVVAEFLGAGAEQAVFRVTGSGPDQVVKFRRNYFAFTVNLLPDQLFPRFRDDRAYEDKLMTRLAALEGSPVLAAVSPLDELWTALAVRRLDGHDESAQELVPEDFQAVARCDFVRGRLEDWSLMDVGRSPEELLEIVVIHQGLKPIHAGFPQHIAQEAKRALAEMPALHGPGTDSVQHNPLLPWIAAAGSGFTIPARSAEYIARSFAQCKDLKATVRQAAQVFRFAIRPRTVSFEVMTGFLGIILSAIGSSASSGEDLRSLFLAEHSSKGNRRQR